ncbi:T9SS type B sorting domain-containing protein [Winogradskyella eckloniae]|uniref:T9SS type B sorting domain-containing protein n=1 Tax=Winogradskyella eckloniae TaxID=1089306 RepID=UPI001567A315|nr:T9SS type B sorting domain-containing protein [Winogradskyella eckloniae]NRD20598.1 T9SS type B sorting domain-containing protein [Winogradskyella eckloniae]
MYIKQLLTFICLLLFFLQSHAQLCEGNLGDPLVEIDFGSGTTRGAALGSDITAFTYSSAGELDEGEYTIANTTSGLKGNAWHVTSDHTGNTNGYMMVINSAVIANEGVFYTKTVSGLCANTTYEFSAWLINIMNPSVGTDEYHPDVTFRVSDTSGNILGSYNTGDIPQTSSGSWLQYGFFFTLENDTEVVITILNSAPSAHPGNDLALDDIAFRPCGPTITNSINDELGSTITLCEGNSAQYTFQADVSSGYLDPQYQWQFSDDLGITWVDIENETTTNYNFTETDTPGNFQYRITVANGINIASTSCRIASEIFDITILEKPEALTGEYEQVFCTTQQATVADLEVNSNAVWYDADTNGNVISNETLLIDGNLYYGAQITNAGCESDERIAVEVSMIVPTLVVNDLSIILCDTNNDDIEVTDLTFYESDITTCTDCNFSYFENLTDAQNYNEDGIIESINYSTNSETNSVFARIDSSDNCYQIAELTIDLEPTPIISISDVVGICEDEDYITIDAGSGFYSYLWSTGATTSTINITNEMIGNYSVTVTENHSSYLCETTKTFEVLQSNTAVIADIDIEDWTDNNNAITIYLSELSLGDYEYSIDGFYYQDSHRFENLSSGEYTVYVRDKNACGITEQVVYLLNYPKFFTPNGDGTNDTWYIKNAATEPSLLVKIFNRYGKLLKVLDANAVWDGTYDGNPLPTSDYWFVVTRTNGLTYRGHFTLKR